jgi:prolyl 4-hydroxylase
MRSRQTATIPPRGVLVIDSFITAAECKAILAELEDASWHSSMVLQSQSNGTRTQIREDYRSSLSLRQEWFSAKLQQLIEKVEQSLSGAFACDPARLELWQATRYNPGDRFFYHLDAGSWRRTKAGERVRSYLLYLNTPRRGGETHFRALNIRIKPKAGRLIAWNNLLPTGGCDYAMVHAGTEVLAGTKTTLVTWERERCIRKEGKSK